MIIKNVSWTVFKSFVQSRSLKFNFFEDSSSYEIYAVDEVIAANCNLQKGSEDSSEFESNFKSRANKRLLNPIKRLDKTVMLIENLKDVAAKDMNVDGSSANKIYSYSPIEGVAFISGITCLLDDPGSSSFRNFGAIAALTNGVEIKVVIGGIATTLTIIKSNADLVTRFRNSHFGNGSSDSLGSANGFGESYDSFVGHMVFERPIELNGADSIQIVIKDNLSNISTLQMSCTVLRDI